MGLPVHSKHASPTWLASAFAKIPDTWERLVAQLWAQEDQIILVGKAMKFVRLQARGASDPSVVHPLVLVSKYDGEGWHRAESVSIRRHEARSIMSITESVGHPGANDLLPAPDAVKYEWYPALPFLAAIVRLPANQDLVQPRELAAVLGADRSRHKWLSILEHFAKTDDQFPPDSSQDWQGLKMGYFQKGTTARFGVKIPAQLCDYEHWTFPGDFTRYNTEGYYTAPMINLDAKQLQQLKRVPVEVGFTTVALPMEVERGYERLCKGLGPNCIFRRGWLGKDMPVEIALDPDQPGSNALFYRCFDTRQRMWRAWQSEWHDDLMTFTTQIPAQYQMHSPLVEMTGFP